MYIGLYLERVVSIHDQGRQSWGLGVATLQISEVAGGLGRGVKYYYILLC